MQTGKLLGYKEVDFVSKESKERVNYIEYHFAVETKEKGFVGSRTAVVNTQVVPDTAIYPGDTVLLDYEVQIGTEKKPKLVAILKS